jgi:hypothetical protein
LKIVELVENGAQGHRNANKTEGRNTLNTGILFNPKQPDLKLSDAAQIQKVTSGIARQDRQQRYREAIGAKGAGNGVNCQTIKRASTKALAQKKAEATRC